MKAKLFFAFAVLALSVGLAPAPAATTPKQCADFCSRARCIGGYVCGLYTDSTGQTVCGCHLP